MVEALVILLLFLEKHALAAMLGWRRMAQVADAVVAGVRLLPPSGLGEISQAAAALRSNFNNTVLKIPRYVEDEEDEDDHSIAEGAPNHTAAALRVPHQHLPAREGAAHRSPRPSARHRTASELQANMDDTGGRVHNWAP